MPRIRTRPGEVPSAEYLLSLALGADRLAAEIDVPVSRVTEILRERRAIAADTAIRLGRRFGTTPQFRMDLQVAHDLSRAEAEHGYSAVRRPDVASDAA